MKKIVILDGFTLNPGDLSWAGFEALGHVMYYDRTPETSILEVIKEADIVITNKTQLFKNVLEKCPNLEYIGVLATGYNVVDTSYCKDHDIVVTNVPSYGSHAVAQHTFALLLALTNKIKEHDVTVKNGKWQQSEDFCYLEAPLFELYDKTIGLIGSGKIGIQVAEIAKAMGMHVLLVDSKESIRTVDEQMSFVSLETLLTTSDVISLHCPLTEKTKNIISDENIKIMKDGVLILNTSRGQLLDEQAVYHHLESGKIGGCGIDVLTEEPPRDNILLKAKNILVTPHIAWAAFEARERLMAVAVDNLKKYLNNQPQNTV